MWARGGGCDGRGELRGAKATAGGHGEGWSAPILTRVMSLDGRLRGARRLSFYDYECRHRSGGGAWCPCHARIPVLVAIPRAVGARACARGLLPTARYLGRRGFMFARFGYSRFSYSRNVSCRCLQRRCGLQSCDASQLARRDVSCNLARHASSASMHVGSCFGWCFCFAFFEIATNATRLNGVVATSTSA